MKKNMKIKVEVKKDRNPYVQHLINKCGGGAHQKSKKAVRQQDKAKLKQEYLDKYISQ